MVVGVGGRIKRLLLFLPAIFYLNAFASEGYSFRGWQWPVSSLGCIQKRGGEVLPRIIPHFRGQRRVSVAFSPESRIVARFLETCIVETRLWISRFDKNCAISVYVVCTRNRMIKFIHSIYWFWRVVIFIVSKIFIVLFFFSGSLLRISKQSDILIATKKKYIHIYI